MVTDVFGGGVSMVTEVSGGHGWRVRMGMTKRGGTGGSFLSGR